MTTPMQTTRVFTRRHLLLVGTVVLIVSVGMWLERFVIIPVSLHRDFLPSSWGMYVPTWADFSMFFGTIGLFFFLMFLFLRFLPMISIFEMRELYHRDKEAPSKNRHKHRPHHEPAAFTAGGDEQ